MCPEQSHGRAGRASPTPTVARTQPSANHSRGRACPTLHLACCRERLHAIALRCNWHFLTKGIFLGYTVGDPHTGIPCGIFVTAMRKPLPYNPARRTLVAAKSYLHHLGTG